GNLWTTCSTRTFGSTAYITCHFSEDLNQTNAVSAVYLQRYSLNESDSRAESVVDCYFLGRKGLECSPNEGYAVKPNISSELTITVQPVAHRFEGRYLCYITPQNKDIRTDYRFCILKFPDRKVLGVLSAISLLLLLLVLGCLTFSYMKNHKIFFPTKVSVELQNKWISKEFGIALLCGRKANFPATINESAGTTTGHVEPGQHERATDYVYRDASTGQKSALLASPSGSCSTIGHQSLAMKYTLPKEIAETVGGRNSRSVLTVQDRFDSDQRKPKREEGRHDDPFFFTTTSSAKATIVETGDGDIVRANERTDGEFPATIDECASTTTGHAEPGQHERATDYFYRVASTGRKSALLASPSGSCSTIGHQRVSKKNLLLTEIAKTVGGRNSRSVLTVQDKFDSDQRKPKREEGRHDDPLFFTTTFSAKAPIAPDGDIVRANKQTDGEFPVTIDESAGTTTGHEEPGQHGRATFYVYEVAPTKRKSALLASPSGSCSTIGHQRVSKKNTLPKGIAKTVGGRNSRSVLTVQDRFESVCNRVVPPNSATAVDQTVNTSTDNQTEGEFPVTIDESAGTTTGHEEPGQHGRATDYFCRVASTGRKSALLASPSGSYIIIRHQILTLKYPILTEIAVGGGNPRSVLTAQDRFDSDLMEPNREEGKIDYPLFLTTTSSVKAPIVETGDGHIVRANERDHSPPQRGASGMTTMTISVVTALMTSNETSSASSVESGGKYVRLRQQNAGRTKRG
ncbi:hypothetical protein BaRGS_00033040, partial [Batillaria attramentaria]